MTNNKNINELIMDEVTGHSKKKHKDEHDIADYYATLVESAGCLGPSMCGVVIHNSRCPINLAKLIRQHGLSNSDLERMNINKLATILANSNRWEKLIKLLGTPANASDSAIKFFWDDATMTPHVIIGYNNYNKKKYYVERGSYDQVMDSIPEPIED